MEHYKRLENIKIVREIKQSQDLERLLDFHDHVLGIHENALEELDIIEIEKVRDICDGLLDENILNAKTFFQYINQETTYYKVFYDKDTYIKNVTDDDVMGILSEQLIEYLLEI